MNKKIFSVIGIILAGCLIFSFSGLYASTQSVHGAYEEEEEYTGQDTSDSIHVSTVSSETHASLPETSHGAAHGEDTPSAQSTYGDEEEYTGRDTPDSIRVNEATSDTLASHPETSHDAEHGTAVEHGDSPAAAGYEGVTGHGETSHVVKNATAVEHEAEYDVEKKHQRTTERAQRNFNRSSDYETGFSAGTWAGLVGVLLVLGCLTFFFLKGTNNMKNMKLGTKIIGMVSVILLLMVISSGFGIIKVGSIGDEIKGIAEEDIPLTGVVTEITTNQLEQAIWLERALRYGEVLASEEKAKEGLSEAEGAFEKYSLLTDDEFKEAEALAVHAARSAKTAEEREAFEGIDENLKDIEKLHTEYEKQVHQIFSLISAGKIHEAEAMAEEVEAEEEELDHELEQFLATIEDFTEEAALNAEHDEQSAVKGMSGISIFSVFLGLFMGIFLTRSITKPVNRIIEELKGGSEQVASASGQISSSSQQMAAGASEQAASIEETSSSLEEMSAMTRQNAENAGEANNLMKDANQVVTQANDAMTALTSSMQEISKASEETSKIIKTIDEIAFQTNLLALNAAVEAARAGEAGAGFAVVADEVRNLAMRAAEASKNTADLIEGTLKRVKDGTELVDKTNGAFTQVADSTGKVGRLVDEIAAASNEQAEGIEQVNLAVGEMDKVVQQNAANSEESASASEEMNAQAVQMQQLVADLLAIVGGNKNGNGTNGSRAHYISHGALPALKKVKSVAMAPKGKMARPDSMGVEVSPENLIPLEDESFANF